MWEHAQERLETAFGVKRSMQLRDPPEANNMRLVGHSDLQARSAYMPTIHRHGNRYIAYIGHHGGTDTIPKPVNPATGQPEFNGTSIVDVLKNHPSCSLPARRTLRIRADRNRGNVGGDWRPHIRFIRAHSAPNLGF